MEFKKILPHLNKFVSLYLVNNRRRVGLLFYQSSDELLEETDVVYFLTVMKGRKLLSAPTGKDLEKLEKDKEIIPIEDIIRIRSIE